MELWKGKEESVHRTNVWIRGNFGKTWWICGLEWRHRRAHTQQHTGKTRERADCQGSEQSIAILPLKLHRLMDSPTHTHIPVNPGNDSGKEHLECTIYDFLVLVYLCWMICFFQKLNLHLTRYKGNVKIHQTYSTATHTTTNAFRGTG